ncbi:hypothetical protein LEP1GSC198_2888 [Leptospira kirschneri str. JB]|nr:hypothetical protein LEP1GSC198_2888 [Leptospira kirschneri str. JB]
MGSNLCRSIPEMWDYRKPQFYGKTLKCGNLPRIWTFTVKLTNSSILRAKKSPLIRKNKKPHRFSGGVFQFPFCLKERIKV